MSAASHYGLITLRSLVICSACSATAFAGPCAYDASRFIYMGKDAEAYRRAQKCSPSDRLQVYKSILELNRSGPFTDADLKELSKSSDHVVSYKAKNALEGRAAHAVHTEKKRKQDEYTAYRKRMADALQAENSRSGSAGRTSSNSASSGSYRAPSQTTEAYNRTVQRAEQSRSDLGRQQQEQNAQRRFQRGY